MVNSINGASAANVFSLDLNSASGSASIGSFAQQLATALEGYLNNGRNGSHFEIDVQSGQGSGLTVNVRDLGSGTSPAPEASATNTTAATAGASVPATATPAAPDSTTIDRSQMTPADAYWAEQPPAVQALRNMPDDERYEAAQELAKQGYTIDVPIMVWGWDPLTTMTLRQNDGYTWVPSGMQPNIAVGPGIANVWNVAGYDANNPPPGSIKVTTDFAIGTNGQDPWIHS